MIRLLKKGRPVFAVMAALALWMALPNPAAVAALIPTAALAPPAGGAARQAVDRLLADEEVRAALAAYGIDPQEAAARARSLTDAEAARVAAEIERLPAGGDAIGLAIGVLLIVLLLVVILKLTGNLR